MVSTSVCMSDCGDLWYEDLVTLHCEECFTGCQKCSGPSFDECTECRNDGANNYYFDSATSSCNLECPDGFYELLAGFLCDECTYPCVTCGTSDTDCKSCDGLYALFGGNKCTLDC